MNWEILAAVARLARAGVLPTFLMTKTLPPAAGALPLAAAELCLVRCVRAATKRALLASLENQPELSFS